MASAATACVCPDNVCRCVPLSPDHANRDGPITRSRVHFPVEPHSERMHTSRLVNLERARLDHTHLLRRPPPFSLEPHDGGALYQPSPPLAHSLARTAPQGRKRHPLQHHKHQLVWQPFGRVATSTHWRVDCGIELALCCLDLSSHRLALRFHALASSPTFSSLTAECSSLSSTSVQLNFTRSQSDQPPLDSVDTVSARIVVVATLKEGEAGWRPLPLRPVRFQ
jgi:hypothetical protein